jgi:hypothetical protein
MFPPPPPPPISDSLASVCNSTGVRFYLSKIQFICFRFALASDKSVLLLLPPPPPRICKPTLVLFVLRWFLVLNIRTLSHPPVPSSSPLHPFLFSPRPPSTPQASPLPPKCKRNRPATRAPSLSQAGTSRYHPCIPTHLFPDLTVSHPSPPLTLLILQPVLSCGFVLTLAPSRPPAL